MTPLQTAAQAVLDRWDSPLWKDQPHTGVYIAELRKAPEAEQAQLGEPVAWVKEDELADLLSCNGRSIWAESPSIWFDEVPQHLVPLYKNPYLRPEAEQAQAGKSFAEVHPANPSATCKCEHWQSCAECHPTAHPAQAVEPVAELPAGECYRTGNTCFQCGHDEFIATPQAPPPVTGERAELIATLHEFVQAMGHTGPVRSVAMARKAADMLEADAAAYEQGRYDELQAQGPSQAEWAAMEAQQVAVPDKPVARVESWTNGSYSRNYKITWLEDVPEGTLLYAAAQGAKR